MVGETMTILAAIGLFLKSGAISLFKWLRGLPWQVWAVLAALVAVWLGWHWHEGQVRKADKAGYSRAVAEMRAASERMTAQAVILKLRAENLQAAATQSVKVIYDQKASAIRTRADVLRVRVPEGLRPVCGPGNSAPLGSAASASGGAAGSDLSGMALIPWGQLVDHGEKCDIYRAQVEGWQALYAKQRAIYEQWRKDYTATLAKAAK